MDSLVYYGKIYSLPKKYQNKLKYTYVPLASKGTRNNLLYFSARDKNNRSHIFKTEFNNQFKIKNKLVKFLSPKKNTDYCDGVIPLAKEKNHFYIACWKNLKNQKLKYKVSTAYFNIKKKKIYYLKLGSESLVTGYSKINEKKFLFTKSNDKILNDRNIPVYSLNIAIKNKKKIKIKKLLNYKKKRILGYGRAINYKVKNKYHIIVPVRNWRGKYDKIKYLITSDFNSFKIKNIECKKIKITEFAHPSLLNIKRKKYIFFNNDLKGSKGIHLIKIK